MIIVKKEKAEKPVAERRQRRDLRKRVRIDDNSTDVTRMLLKRLKYPLLRLFKMK